MPVTITGTIPDYLLGGGMLPSVDATQEYMAGGGRGFPLVGQLLLTQSIDDLTRDLGMQVYETMMNDPTVAAAVNSLIAGVLNGKFQVRPRYTADPGETIPKGSERERDISRSAVWAEFITRQHERQPRPVKATSFEMLHGLCFGTKLAEKVFEEGLGIDRDKIVLKRVRTKRNDSWNFVVTPYGDLVAVRGLIVGGGIVDFPPEKFMIFTWMPQDGDPRGHSILRPAYNGWNLKISSWPKLFKYLHRFGSPIMVATAADNAPDEPGLDQQGNPTGSQVAPTIALGQQMARLQGGDWMAMRAGSTFNLYSPVGNGEAFLSAIQIFKHEILEGILLTARGNLEAQHGSKADTQEAHWLIERLIAMGRETLDAMYERQLWHHLITLNAGKDEADRYTPRCSHGEVERKDVAKVMGAYTAAGYQIDPAHLPHIDAQFGLPPRVLGTVQDGQYIEKDVDPEGDDSDVE